MPRLMFSFFSLLILSCAAEAVADAQTPRPCDPLLPSDPSYYADIKEMPGGEWALAYAPDRSQNQDASAPVVVQSLFGVTSKKNGGGRFRCVELENRSARVVRAVQLRWAVTAGVDGEVLVQGRLPPIEVEIAAGVRLKVELQGAHFADFLQPLVKGGVLTGDYMIRVGVARVEFTDGTVEEKAGSN